jgi:hypothetical protein
MTTRLEELQKQSNIYAVAGAFYRGHRDVFCCEGNTSILADAVEALQLPQTLDSWEKIYPSVQSQLATSPKEVEDVPPEPQYPTPPSGFEKFGTIRNLADARRLIPGAIFRDYMYDRDSRTGQISAKSQAFREWLDALQRQPRGEQ